MLPVIPASPADGVKRLECSSERLGAGSHAISKAALAAGENAARLVREQCPAEPTEDRPGVFDSRTLSTESRREHWKHRFRDGRSNVDVEIGKVECGAKHDADRPAETFIEYESQNNQQFPARAVLAGQFKLVDYLQSTDQFFDLKRDPKEERNLADEPAYAGIVKVMRARLDTWRKRTKDPTMPR